MQVDCETKARTAALAGDTASAPQAPTITLLPFFGATAASGGSSGANSSAGNQTVYLEYGKRAPFSLEPCASNASVLTRMGAGGTPYCAATASDPQEGDLSQYITAKDVTACSGAGACARCTAVAMTLGTCLPGQYRLQFGVSDVDGNEAKAVLSVYVEQLATSVLNFTLQVGGAVHGS